MVPCKQNLSKFWGRGMVPYNIFYRISWGGGLSDERWGVCVVIICIDSERRGGVGVPGGGGGWVCVFACVYACVVSRTINNERNKQE